MASTKLLIKTTLGTTIRDLESRVDVHLNKDIYLEKQAIDLNIGDSVDWKKEYIQTTLDKVDTLLESSPRYMHAKKEVFERNAEGEYIPLLRTLLWRGILKKKRRYNPSLESIIRKEEGDFNKFEYREAKEFVMNLLSRGGFQISESSIRKWLEGEIYTPLDWRFFTALANINKAFKEFDETNPDCDGKYYNYKFFVTARRNIMGYLARMKGIELKTPYQEPQRDKTERFSIRQFFTKAKQTVMRYLGRIKGIEPQGDERDRLDIRLDNEIDIVVKSLLGDKDEDYAPAKILSIEKLNPKHPLNREIRRTPEHILSKGIERRKEALETRRKDLVEFLQDFFLINSLFSNSINRYVDSHYKKEFELFIVKDGEGNIKGYSEGLKHLFLYKYNEPETYRSSFAFKRMHDLLEFDDEKIDYADRVTDLLLDDVFNGKIDEYLGIPQDSLKNLLEAEYQLRAARPKAFTEQEQALDHFENCLRRMNDCQEKGHPKGSMEYNYRLENIAREAHDTLMRIERRIESRFPVKFSKEYHGSIMLTYLKSKDSGEEEKPTDVERVIKDYNLEEFRDLMRF